MEIKIPMSEVAFWFRRDLRWQDNRALWEAAAKKKDLRLFFIFDKKILDELNSQDHRVTFLWKHLNEMNLNAPLSGLKIEIRYGNPKDVWVQILKDYPLIESVYYNHDYEPYALQRDKEINEFFKTHRVSSYSFKDQVIFEKHEILSDKNSIYLVYTPYKNKWLQKLTPIDVTEYKINWKEIKIPIFNKAQNLTLNELGFKESVIIPPSIYFKPQHLKSYGETRDFPFLKEGTTHMGLALRFGLVSIRFCVKKAKELNADVWLSELIWREFFMQILFHFPQTEFKEFRPEYSHIQWRDNSEELQRWQEGQTGVPLVDAGMRQLKATGYMHNRVRMMVASYLTKHLLHHWKKGERHFANLLFDFDLSANIGNWQWSAGCGVDAAPYFRVFNPELQQKKFDPQREYINYWVPEWNSSRYPNPMVDHDYARKRAISTFKEGLANG